MSQKKDTLIKLALVVTVSLISFSSGVFLGKTYSDNNHKLKQLEPASHASADAHEFAADNTGEVTASHDSENKPAEENTLGHDAKLTDSEVAKMAEEFAADETEPATDEKPIANINDHAEKTIKTISPHAETHSNKPATVSNPKPKITTETEPRGPASIPVKKDIVPIHFTVQVGSFPTEAEAQKMTKDLLQKGFKTSVVSAQVNGQTWFRVNVGLFGTSKEAEEYKIEFLEKSKLTSAFVQKVVNLQK